MSQILPINELTIQTPAIDGSPIKESSDILFRPHSENCSSRSGRTCTRARLHSHLLSVRGHLDHRCWKCLSLCLTGAVVNFVIQIVTNGSV